MDIKYLVYQITNKSDGKIYIGVHKTTKPDDSYMGSGKRISNAIRKHGRNNFTKTILAAFDNPEDMFQMESVLVNEEFVDREDTYNLKPGGCDEIGHFEKMSALGLEARQKKLKWLRENDPEWRAREIAHMNKIRTISNGLGFKGKKHSNASKIKMGEKNSKHQAGEGNSQFGTCWVYSIKLQQSKRIKTDELDKHLNGGWLKGRKMFTQPKRGKEAYAYGRVWIHNHDTNKTVLEKELYKWLTDGWERGRLFL